MNKQLGPITSGDDEKFIYVSSQYKGACITYGKYRDKGKYCFA